jgi:hypothetical protein
MNIHTRSIEELERALYKAERSCMNMRLSLEDAKRTIAAICIDNCGSVSVSHKALRSVPKNPSLTQEPFNNGVLIRHEYDVKLHT